MEDSTNDERERRSPQPPDTYGRAPTATVSSFKSEDSTEQLICHSTREVDHDRDKKEKSVTSRSAETSASAGGGARRLVAALGLAQLVLGALLLGGGAVGAARGAALGGAGAALWAGGAAVAGGLLGLLAGINDCYGLNRDPAGGSSPLLSSFLALSLVGLACGNAAGALAVAGLHRESLRPPPQSSSYEDEVRAWTPVMSNIVILVVACLHCLVCIVTIFHLSKRICPCFRPKRPYDHNQFDPSFKNSALVTPYVVHLDENDKKKVQNADKVKSHELCKELEMKLQGDVEKLKKKERAAMADSEASRVSSWLQRGRRPPHQPHQLHQPHHSHQPHPPRVLLLPAPPPTTLGRIPVSVVVPPRYATLPLPPYGPPHAPLYYPVHDARVRRRRSPAERRGGRRGARAERGTRGGERGSRLTRSLERIHRKRRAAAAAERERLSDAELQQSYTGVDRAYAEQFIAVCDSSRSQAAERSDSLTSCASSDLAARRPTRSARD